MWQTVSMFSRYLNFPETRQNNMVRASMEKSSEAMVKPSWSTGPLHQLPPQFGLNGSRHPSFLEQKLLPVLRSDAMLSDNCDGKSSAAQLTIFYAGAISVFDNVTIEKARAIMLLASESSLSKPNSPEVQEIDIKKPIPQSNLTSSCRLRTDVIPIARKVSLRHFLEKRRRRIASKSPCSHSNGEQKHTKSEKDYGSNENEDNKISLSPFPSRLGFFFPVSATPKNSA